MKKLTCLTVLATTIVSFNAFANGGKAGDPYAIELVSRNGGKAGDPYYAIQVANNNGGKAGDPTEEDNGGKAGDPTQQDNGGKAGDPNGRVIAKDSGYPTLTALLSKYFSI